jgi:hypothetical protein
MNRLKVERKREKEKEPLKERKKGRKEERKKERKKELWSYKNIYFNDEGIFGALNSSNFSSSSTSCV